MESLKGTEKQINYAERLREENTPDAVMLRERAEKAGMQSAVDLVDAVMSIDSAKWWIEEGSKIGKIQFILAKLGRGAKSQDDANKAVYDYIERIKKEAKNA
jgi:hypothetical protein